MQTKAANATRGEQHSLAPIQLEATSLERDLAAIKRGQGRRLMVSLLLSLLAMAALIQWMSSDDGRAYAAAAKQLDSLYARQAAAFADCALLQPNASQQELRTAIEAASQQQGKAYGKQLVSCNRALSIVERQLTDVDVPLNLQHRVEELRRAASALNRAIGGYRSYLSDPSRTYDFATAAPQIDDVVAAWSNHDIQRHKTVGALSEAMQQADAHSKK